MSTAEYQRRWRASKGAGTGQPGRPVTAPHGTVAAYKRHLKHGEQPCPACREANAEKHRQLYRQRASPAKAKAQVWRANPDGTLSPHPDYP